MHLLKAEVVDIQLRSVTIEYSVGYSNRCPHPIARPKGWNKSVSCYTHGVLGFGTSTLLYINLGNDSVQVVHYRLEDATMMFLKSTNAPMVIFIDKLRCSLAQCIQTSANHWTLASIPGQGISYAVRTRDPLRGGCTRVTESLSRVLFQSQPAHCACVRGGRSFEIKAILCCQNQSQPHIRRVMGGGGHADTLKAPGSPSIPRRDPYANPTTKALNVLEGFKDAEVRC